MASVVVRISMDARGLIYADAGDVPARKVAIVFGAQVRPDRSLSPILRDRVDGGIALYRAQRVKKLLMSGDNSTSHYDEVTAMKDYAVRQGVPEDDIVLDYAGFDTYDTCYRARDIFGQNDVVLVTQRYHLPRALYTCNKLGVKAIGYGLPDFSKYPSLRVSYTVREWFADQKAWWQVNITRPKPKYLGDSVEIN